MKPEQVLKSLSSAEKPKLILISGPAGSGKTSWCQQLIALAREQNLMLRGLLSPPVFDESTGRKIGIDLINLATNKRHNLAHLRQSKDTEGIFTKRWQFDEAVLAWGNTLLKTQHKKTIDLLIIDELGPLEFKQQQGWQASFEAIERQRYRLACVTVNPNVLEQAQQYWPTAQVYIIEP